MNKEQLLQEIKSSAAQGILSKQEIDQAYSMGMVSANNGTGQEEVSRKISIGEVLAYLGGAIVFIGICVFVFQHWSELSSFTRILATLGSGIAAYFIGVLITKNGKAAAIAQAFFLISALVLPIGLAVVLDNAGVNTGDSGAQTLMSAVLLLTYLISYFIFRKNLFTLFSLIFGTWLFYSITSWMVGGSPVWDSHFFEYRTLVTGLSYMLFGYAFANTPLLRRLTSWLYAIGTIFFLGAAITLGGYSPDANGFWEVLFAGLVFGIIFLSVYLRSRAMLIFGSLFLMGYVLKITFEYFSQSLSWAFSLIIAGLLLIAVGYFAYFINRKYLKGDPV